MNLNDRRDITLTLRVDIIESAAHSVVHDIHGHHKDCASCASRELTEEHRHSFMSISSIFWSSIAMKATDILIASSLALKHGYTIMNYKANKCRSVWWKHLSFSATKKLKSARR
jgi:hypothetical protein